MSVNTMDLTCSEQMTEEGGISDLLDVPVPMRRIDLAEALERRVRAEHNAVDRRNPRYVEQVQRHGMTVKWRARMCRWMFATGEAFKLALDTVGAAVHFLDLYLSLHSVDHVVIQLVAMLSLCVASKMHEHRPITMLEMDLLCEHKFSHAQMIAMEKQLLLDLDWELNPAVSFTFARDLLQLAAFEDEHEQQVIEEQAMEVLQRASIAYDSLGFKASVLGCASLLAVVQMLVPHNVKRLGKVLPMLACDDDEFEACVDFIEGVYDVARNEARQLASPTSVEAIVVETKAKTTAKPTTQAKPEAKNSGSNSRKRARDEESSTPKRRRLAME